ncbi:hypothetical protein [Pseudomonas sp. ICMP 561]|nr:hypothetical protein [Pseudomonas sp. ICMP 561]
MSRRPPGSSQSYEHDITCGSEFIREEAGTSEPMYRLEYRLPE